MTVCKETCDTNYSEKGLFVKNGFPGGTELLIGTLNDAWLVRIHVSIKLLVIPAWCGEKIMTMKTASGL